MKRKAEDAGTVVFVWFLLLMLEPALWDATNGNEAMHIFLNNTAELWAVLAVPIAIVIVRTFFPTPPEDKPKPPKSKLTRWVDDQTTDWEDR